MPHFQIDYSPNLEARLDIAALCAVLRDAAMETGIFPLAGVRVRATPVAHIVIADGNPDHAFLDLSVRLREGRDLEIRKRATAQIFEAMQAFCAPVLDSSSLLLSMEMRNIDADLAPKVSSTANYL